MRVLGFLWKLKRKGKQYITIKKEKFRHVADVDDLCERLLLTKVICVAVYLNF